MIKEKVSKLPYPKLQRCFRMLHIMHTTIIIVVLVNQVVVIKDTHIMDQH